MTEHVTVSAMGRAWSWPAGDVKCRAVVFDELVALPKVYRYLKASRTAIQAGGNMGAFPWMLARQFARVITAEPDPLCFPHLDRNVTLDNVTKLNVAFGEKAGSVAMSRPESNNLGAQYIKAGNESPMITIDSLGVSDCDLIYLDIEGAEMLALKGAVGTIGLSRPVIAVEDKGLSSRFGTAQGDIGKWLALNFGYRAVGKSKRDFIFACE